MWLNAILYPRGNFHGFCESCLSYFTYTKSAQQWLSSSGSAIRVFWRRINMAQRRRGKAPSQRNRGKAPERRLAPITLQLVGVLAVNDWDAKPNAHLDVVWNYRRGQKTQLISIDITVFPKILWFETFVIAPEKTHMKQTEWCYCANRTNLTGLQLLAVFQETRTEILRTIVETSFLSQEA